MRNVKEAKVYISPDINEGGSGKKSRLFWPCEMASWSRLEFRDTQVRLLALHTNLVPVPAAQQGS